MFTNQMASQGANNESSEVCVNIKHGRKVKLNRSQIVNVHKLLTIRYLQPGSIVYAKIFN